MGWDSMGWDSMGGDSMDNCEQCIHVLRSLVAYKGLGLSLLGLVRPGSRIYSCGIPSSNECYTRGTLAALSPRLWCVKQPLLASDIARSMDIRRSTWASVRSKALELSHKSRVACARRGRITHLKLTARSSLFAPEGILCHSAKLRASMVA
jgi:hypothetical protein